MMNFGEERGGGEEYGSIGFAVSASQYRLRSMGLLCKVGQSLNSISYFTFSLDS